MSDCSRPAEGFWVAALAQHPAFDPKEAEVNKEHIGDGLTLADDPERLGILRTLFQGLHLNALGGSSPSSAHYTM